MLNNPLDQYSKHEITLLEERLRPGRYSYTGFLDESETLRTVIEKDAKTLADLGITHEQVADRLDTIMGFSFRQWELAARTGEDYFKTRDRGAVYGDALKATAIGWMGFQECPFSVKRPSCGHGSHDFTVENLASGERVNFPQLMAHLVRDHAFFEGNTRYRLDPATAVRVLDIRPGVSYAPRMGTETMWAVGSSSSNPDDDYSQTGAFMRKATHRSTAFGMDIYVRGDNALIVSKGNVDLDEPLIIDGAPLFEQVIFRGRRMLSRKTHKYVEG